MNTYNTIAKSKMGQGRLRRASLVWATLALAPALLASCGIVDSTPDTKPAATDVKPYYAKLETPKMQYHYQTSYAKSGAASTPNTLQMEMYGRSSYDYMGMPTYGCDWTFQSGFTTKWYYALSQDSAVDLGDSNFGEHWTDLKAPLAAGNTWTFQRVSGEIITAKITQYGAAVKVNGRQFSDVVAVEYTGDRGTSSVRWFAKDIGMIFSHAQNADGSVAEEKFVDMGMEN